MWTAPGDTVYISEVHKLAKWTTDTTPTTTTPATIFTPAAAASPTSNTATIITPATPTATDTSIAYAPSSATTTNMQTVSSCIYENDREVKIIVLHLLNERLTERFGPSTTTISTPTTTTAVTLSTDHPQGFSGLKERDEGQPSLPFFDPLLCPPPPPHTSSQSSSSGSNSLKNEWTCGIVVCIPLRLGEGSTIAPIYIEV